VSTPLLLILVVELIYNIRFAGRQDRLHRVEILV